MTPNKSNASSRDAPGEPLGCDWQQGKAFAGIPREGRGDALRELVLRSTQEPSYSGAVGSERLLEAGTGVGQGSVLSPLLFILFRSKFLGEMRESLKGISEYNTYADDVAQVANTKEGLQRTMQQLIGLLKGNCMKLSYSKS